MSRHVSVLPFLALAALVLGACSSNTQGNPAPAQSTATTSTAVSSSSSSAVGDPMASTDPCTLLDPAVISQNHLSHGTPGTGPGDRDCHWDLPSAASNGGGYTIGILIYDQAGLDQLNTVDFAVTDHPVGRHQGRLSKGTHSGTCMVSLEISKTSRVDVFGDDGGGKIEASCVIATQIAPSVEQKLPAVGS